MQEGTPKYDLPICIQDQPPADSRCQTSFIQIDILTLTNYYLDIHVGFPKYDLPILYMDGLHDQPPADSSCQTLFLV